MTQLDKKPISLWEVIVELWNKIQYWSDVLNLKKVNAGTQITMWVAWDVVWAVWLGKTVALIVLFDKEDYKTAIKNIEERNLSNNN